jgi:hypothetical protein
MRTLSEALPNSLHLTKVVAKGARYCAHRVSIAPSKSASLSLQRVAWLILECARRTSTFLSCAFREQEDDQADRSPLFYKERF